MTRHYTPSEREEAHKECPTLSAMLQRTYELIPPEDLHIYEPRKITTPGAYHSLRTVAGGLYTLVCPANLKIKPSDFTIPQQATAQAISYAVINARFPIYYVADDFIRAVANTELPKDLRIEELKWPVEALVFGFPVKFMQEYIGVDVCYVYACQQPRGPMSTPFLPEAPEIVVPTSKVSWMWLWYKRGYAENILASFQSATLADAIVTDYGYSDWTGDAQTKVDEKKAVADKVSLLILKLLCVLNWRDGLISPSTITRPPTEKRGEKRPALWSPNIIGAHYRSGVAAGTGTHASPRLHRRRGHWTYQAIGNRDDIVPVLSLPRTSDGYIDWKQVTPEIKEAFWRTHQRRWIEPVLVGVQT